MRIAYLNLSPEQNHESGIVRYGRYLSEAIAQQTGVETVAIDLPLSDRHSFHQDLNRRLQSIQSCEILHLQYSKYLGLTGWKKLQLLKKIRQQFAGKLCITLHDVYRDLYPAYDVVEAWGYENKRLRSFSQAKSLALRSTATCLWQNHLADKAIMAWILRYADQVLVCNRAEAERLSHFDGADGIQVIPHFVESRPELPSQPEARAALGLGPEKIVTLQGFIYRSKGHALLLDALSHLPQSVQVIFAGGMAPNQAALERELRAQIERLGLGDRVRITGYLSETALEQYLVASDLAVCPFQIVSASGSLSTWISVGCPILASALPQVQELNQLVPGAIATFSPYTAEALAAAIQTCLAQDAAIAQTKIKQLQQKLSLSEFADHHLRCYQTLDTALGEKRTQVKM